MKILQTQLKEIKKKHSEQSKTNKKCIRPPKYVIYEEDKFEIYKTDWCPSYITCQTKRKIKNAIKINLIYLIFILKWSQRKSAIVKHCLEFIVKSKINKQCQNSDYLKNNLLHQNKPVNNEPGIYKFTFLIITCSILHIFISLHFTFMY